MAHFRDIQTNSSALTYSFPPPTVISGIMAAVLGLEKDSYYETLAPDCCFLALEPLVPTRKVIYTVNYQVTFEPGVTQIPFEVVVPEAGDEIIYRIYFSCADGAFFDKLRTLTSRGRSTFPIYMGSASFLAQLEYLGEGEAKPVPSGTEVEVSTVFRARGLEIADKSEEIKLIPTYMRREFKSGRKPGRAEVYFLSTGKRPIIRATGNLYSIKFPDSTIHACRM